MRKIVLDTNLINNISPLQRKVLIHQVLTLGFTDYLYSLDFADIQGTETFLTVKEGVSKIIPSFFTIKEGSTSLTKPLSCPKREDVTALRCSEPLRFIVGGPSEVFPYFAGWDRLEEESSLYYHILKENPRFVS